MLSNRRYTRASKFVLLTPRSEDHVNINVVEMQWKRRKILLARGATSTVVGGCHGHGKKGSCRLTTPNRYPVKRKLRPMRGDESTIQCEALLEDAWCNVLEIVNSARAIQVDRCHWYLIDWSIATSQGQDECFVQSSSFDHGNGCLRRIIEYWAAAKEHEWHV